MTPITENPPTNIPPEGPTEREGRRDRGEDRLRLMYVLSSGSWLTLPFAIGLAGLPREYGRELISELEDEGLLWTRYQPWSRSMIATETIVSRRRPTTEMQTRTGLTDEGHNSPELEAFAREQERLRTEHEERRRQMPLRRHARLALGDLYSRAGAGARGLLQRPEKRRKALREMGEGGWLILVVAVPFLAAIVLISLFLGLSQEVASGWL